MTDEAPTPLPAGGQNAIAVTFGLLGDEWTLLILRHAHQGVRRYQEWRERLPISDAVLAGRLGRLTEQGLLARVPYQQAPVRYEYGLTARGRSLWPVLVSIWGWELRWVAGRRDELPRMRHRSCGRPGGPVLVCAGCGGPAGPREVRSALGPSGDPRRSIPAAATRRRSASGSAGPAGQVDAAGPVDTSGLFPETTALLGNRWSVALLGAAFLGDHRFGEFQQRLGAPPTIVADRLRTFCTLGVLRAVDSAYRLTDKGRAFFPVVVALIDWGQRWYAAPEGPALVSVHRSCGRLLRPRLVCGACGERLVERDVLVIGDAERAVSGTR